MKSWIMVALMFVGAQAWPCDKGCVPYEGVCACDAPASDLGPMHETNWVSDEKPSRHPEPAWQRGEVKAIDLPSLAVDDARQDLERAQADREGKLAAGIGKAMQ